MRFLKMHGCGNDFVLVNTAKESVENPADAAVKVCCRKYGVGADGLILVMPSDKADLRMRIFNPDGSEPEMCGNGIRCFAKFAQMQGLVKTDSFRVETLAGILTTSLSDNAVRVDMGEPILQGGRIPVNVPKPVVVNEELWVGEKLFRMTCVSMGNPHCVVLVPEITDDLVLHWGPHIENHGIFPKKTNTEFARVISRKEVQMRVWERGAGETLACGTGACATAVAGVLNDKVERQCRVHLRGGDLDIEWSEADNHVYMTGPAEAVFEGKWIG